MIVCNLPRWGGKTTAVARYMAQPGNQDVVCLTPTERQADVAWQLARQYDPTIERTRFMRFNTFNPQGNHQRVVIDEADGVLSQLLGAPIEMIALTGEPSD